MKPSIALSVLTLSLVSVLSGCGGGGGGGDDAGGIATLDSIDFSAVVGASANLSEEASANKTAAAAADQATNSEAAANIDPGLLTGVESNSSVQAKNVNDVLSRLPQWLTSNDYGVLSAAETRSCSYSGSITVSSNTSNRSVLRQGDSVALTADRCTEDENGLKIVIHGSLNAAVVSGSISSSGALSSGTRLNFEFNRFQMNYSQSGESGSVGINGGLSLAYSRTGNSSFTSTSLPNQPTLTTVIRYNGTQVRHTISDFQLTYNDLGFATDVSGYATVNSSTPSLGVPSQYRWQTANPLRVSNDRITSGSLLLTAQLNGPSVTVRFGQSCVPSGIGCVTIQRTINGNPQPIQTLTWAQFDALNDN
jgi:hypothetical protein